jgi:hypothetical protein
MLNCNITTCLPHVIGTCTIIIGLTLAFYVSVYLYLMYNTYKYHSDDLKSWRDQKIKYLYDDQDTNPSLQPPKTDTKTKKK